MQRNNKVTDWFTLASSWLPYQFQTLYNNIALGSGRPPYLASLLHNYSPPRTVRSSSAKLLIKFCAIIFHSAHVLVVFLLRPPGTRFHRMSVIVHHFLVFGTTSKHTISVLPSLPPPPLRHLIYMRLDSNLTMALHKSFTYLLTYLTALAIKKISFA